MLTAGANKALRMLPTANPDRCPICRAAGPCRPVLLGYWCQRDGLIEDTSRWIIPTQDPVEVAVRSDPKVLAAGAVLEDREREVEAAHVAWIDKLRAASSYRLKAGGDTFVNEGGMWQPRRRDTRKLTELLDAAEAARVAMEDASELAVRARTAHDGAVTEARIREVNKERDRQAT